MVGCSKEDENNEVINIDKEKALIEVSIGLAYLGVNDQDCDSLVKIISEDTLAKEGGLIAKVLTLVTPKDIEKKAFYDGCLETMEKAPNVEYMINTIKVSGEKATAELVLKKQMKDGNIKEDETTIKLEKEGEIWRLMNIW
ncbi:hypothetical protein [Neobacillus niacini]|uniref:hypothetical protein n=1 Tax=Neobacillus niacini TaxID=86668 RepID=UPI002FFDC682